MKPKVSRAETVLKVLIETYIRHGEPVGSATLANQLSDKASPATIRNVMAQLERNGLIRSPHTSAGRVPTPLGYRMFVDSLVRFETPASASVQQLQQSLDPDKSPLELIRSASEALSELTSLAGVVMVPRSEMASMRQIEFLPLEGRRVLVILVLNDSEVQNRIIQTDREYDRSELQQAANYLNQHYSGHSVGAIRAALLEAMRGDKAAMDALSQTVIDVAARSFEGGDDAECVVSGQSNLLHLVEQQNVEQLKNLFTAFQYKNDLLRIMDSCSRADGIQIFIGQESGYDLLDECSMITSPYGTPDEVLGVLAVIGPTRVPYQALVPVVDITAKILSSALKPVR